MFRTKLERITVDIKFPDNFEIEDEYAKNIREQIEQQVREILSAKGILQYELSAIMSSRHKAEVLYQEGDYRIITTKASKAVLQIRVQYKKDSIDGFYWKDHAWFGTGELDDFITKAKNEIDRIKVKGRLGKRKITTKRESYLKKLPELDKSLLDTLLSQE